MISLHVATLLALLPTLLLVLMGLKAIRSRQTTDWYVAARAIDIANRFVHPSALVFSVLLSKRIGLPFAYFTFALLMVNQLAAKFISLRGGTILRGDDYSKYKNYKYLWILAVGYPSGVSVCLWLLFRFAGGIQLNVQLFVISGICGYAGYRLLASKLDDLVDYAILGPGELHKRIHAMAAQHRLELDHIWICLSPYNKYAGAAAVAYTDKSIRLDERLVKKLSRLELESVINHELGHVNDRKIWPLLQLGGVFKYYGVLLLAALALEDIAYLPEHWHWLTYVVWYNLLFFPFLVSHWFSRRLERTAEINAAKRSDPEAAIRAEYKLAFLNGLPLENPRWIAWTSTHPSLQSNIQRIADAVGFDDRRLKELENGARLSLESGNVDNYGLSLIDVDQAQVNRRQMVAKITRGRSQWWSLAWNTCLMVVCLAGTLISIMYLSDHDVVAAWPYLLITVAWIALGVYFSVRARRRLKDCSKEINRMLAELYPEALVASALPAEICFWDNVNAWVPAGVAIENGNLLALTEHRAIIIPLKDIRDVVKTIYGQSSSAVAAAIVFDLEGGKKRLLWRLVGHRGKGMSRSVRQLVLHIKTELTARGVTLAAPFKATLRNRTSAAIRFAIVIAAELAVLTIALVIGQAENLRPFVSIAYLGILFSTLEVAFKWALEPVRPNS